MNSHAKLFCAVAVSAFAAFAATSPAQALTPQECSAKYQAAKTAGTLAGQKWNDFRKAQCGADAAAAPAAATPAATPAAPKEAAAKPKKEGRRDRRGAGSTRRPGGVSLRRGSEIFQGNRRQGADAHLRGPMEGQQGRQYHRRPAMDPEGRRLLERVQQEAEGLSRYEPSAAGLSAGRASASWRKLASRPSRPDRVIFIAVFMLPA